VPYLSASAVVIHYEEALYQGSAPLPLPLYYYAVPGAVSTGALKLSLPEPAYAIQK